VANPLKITLRQLLEEYENVTYPVTLVCAGNRRKEQNVVRKSKGFSWGPAGLSTALFTGVVMKDIIERAKPLRKAKYVCMEGADKLVSCMSVGNVRHLTLCLAQWILWYFREAQLGYGPKPGHHVGAQDERRDAET
jgi:DMSO/TMAO reductase YedYZ molybdopterin-dependent catalytic subunit